MQRRIVLSIVVLGFGLFCYLCLRQHSFMIQQDVSGRVSKVLATNQISSAGVSIDGRDVVLAGPAGSHEISEDTQKLVAGVYGVRTVAIRAIAPAEAAPDARAIAPKIDTQGKLDAILAQSMVEFNPASAQLTARGRNALNRVAPLLADSPTLFCEIQGHTDSLGNSDANQSLSYRRAIETKNYLVNQGIAPERLIPKAFGDTQPIASNDTAAGRQRNRRINFVLREKP